jgi:hypothetical protein
MERNAVVERIRNDKNGVKNILFTNIICFVTKGHSNFHETKQGIYKFLHHVKFLTHPPLYFDPLCNPVASSVYYLMHFLRE